MHVAAGIAKAVLGSCVIVVPLEAYSAYVGSIPVFFESNLSVLAYVAYLVMVVMTVGVVIVALSVRQFLGESKAGGGSRQRKLAVIARVLDQRQYKLTMVAVMIAYAALFAIVSGTLVFRPLENFAVEYSAKIPSVTMAVCCGSMGLVPVLTVYLTSHMALLIIPLNILILIGVSALVGLNTSLVAYEYDNRPRSGSRRWIFSLGAVTGLFTACPTCAGLFFSSLITGVGATTALAVLPSTQLLFVAGTIVVLVGAVYVSTRAIEGSETQSCKLPRR